MSVDRHNLSSQKPPQAQTPPPVFGGIRFGPALAAVLYLLLVGSAALALWSQRFQGNIPRPLAAASPWAFLAFTVAFALYRLALVRARRYPAFKAFFQVGVAVFFFTLLLPGAQQRYAGEVAGGLETLIEDSNPHVRALAAEVARHRPGPTRYGRMLVKALRDPSPEVRDQAHRSLVQITGQDLGSPDSPEAVRAWGDRYP